MDSRGLIHHLCDASQRPSGGPVAVLRHLRDGPATASELARACSMSPSTVANNCRRFVAAGFLAHDGVYEFTGTGLVFFARFEDVTGTLPPRDITALSASEYRLPVLRSIAETPGRSCRLQHRDGLPSRTAISEALKQFRARDWLTEDTTGELGLTDTGRTAMTTYEAFLGATEAVIAAASFLQRLGERSLTLPSRALADATLIEESQYEADTLADAVLRLVEGESDSESRSITSLVSSYSPLLVERFVAALEEDGPYRFLLDAETARRVRISSHRDIVETVSSRPGVDIRAHREALPFGFTTDGERIVVGAHGSPSEYPAGLVSTSETLVDWAMDIHARYWETAEPLSFEPGGEGTRFGSS